MNKDFNFIVKITTNCPGNCKCCINRQRNFKLKNENNNFFDIGVYKKICKNIKKLGGSYVCLSGGEPTIVPSLGKYIKIAHKEGLATRINSNGWNINELNFEEWLKYGLDQIVLSVYGVDEETIIKTRGNSLIYKRSMEALKVIKKLKNKYNFIFIIQTIIMKDTYHKMPDILKLVIENKADIFWPSYLEDAVNLPEIRLNKEEIIDFKINVIPKMKKITIDSSIDNDLKDKIILSLDNYYVTDFEEYVYHKENCNCHWIGKHFTFYPNGKIDPCPGHEYFESNYQYKIDYNEINEFMTIENLTKNQEVCFDYCKFCPQGIHQEISFINSKYHEHSKKEEIYDI